MLRRFVYSQTNQQTWKKPTNIRLHLQIQQLDPSNSKPNIFRSFYNSQTRTYSNQNSNEIKRLENIRNVGIFAHVDAGKTTVTERMLALAGRIHRVGSVDDGNTVTDFLPMERERGITIQSAAISFHWDVHNSDSSNDEKQVEIHLIDTPGHVDFSVEVNRSVAVLDGAILVLDSVAGVQAQTETVWNAMSKSMSERSHKSKQDMPCIAVINKMDKDGCHYGAALESIQQKLPRANPVAIQLPLFELESRMIDDDTTTSNNSNLPPNLVTVMIQSSNPYAGRAKFVGMLDLIHFRAIIYPDLTSQQVSNVEDCLPQIITLNPASNCPVAQIVQKARLDLISQLADHDDQMEEYYLEEVDPTHQELQAAIRRVTLNGDIVPVLAGAALRGKGVEPILDAVADYLPSPLDRPPPILIPNPKSNSTKRKSKKGKNNDNGNNKDAIPYGHPLHPHLLALAFKVVHMKNKGSGDGRVVFVRVYSGSLHSKSMIQISSQKKTERILGMLELNGGRFGHLDDGTCWSGQVCALVGLKHVMTGDTLVLPTKEAKSKKISPEFENVTKLGDVCLAGVTAPNPVLTVQVETSSTSEDTKLSQALHLLSIEDPSLHIEETETSTLVSGLGELHMEVTMDRLRREFGLEVTTGPPAVAHYESVSKILETEGFVKFDRTIGDKRLEASVHILLEPIKEEIEDENHHTVPISEPLITLGSKARSYLELDESQSDYELYYTNELVKSVISGCQGSLRRGAIGPYPMSNVLCHVLDIDSEGGLSYLYSNPGALRASIAHAISSLLSSEEGKRTCKVLEPTMSVEIISPPGMVGSILSDLNTRRGLVGEVTMGEEHQEKALIHAYVPLKEILGYANSLRSLTGGEASFSAEYKGHSPCDTF